MQDLQFECFVPNWTFSLRTYKKCIFSDIFPQCFDGGKLIFSKGLSSHFQVSHTINLSTVNPASSGYRFGATYVGSKQTGPQEVCTRLFYFIYVHHTVVTSKKPWINVGRKRFTVCTEILIILGMVRFTIRGGRLRCKRYDAHFLKKSSVELPFSSFGDHLINILRLD